MTNREIQDAAREVVADVLQNAKKSGGDVHSEERRLAIARQ